MASGKFLQVLVSAPARVGDAALLSAPLKTSKVGKRLGALNRGNTVTLLCEVIKVSD